MIKLDGAVGEGGGQIVRSALTLSAITKIPVEIFNLRQLRKPAGLQPQHLTAAQALAEICTGKLEGAELHSQYIHFYPGEIQGGDYFFDIKTAGSLVLVLQTLLPALLFAKLPSTVHIIGGTHLPKSPSIDYFVKVFLPAIRRFGCNVDLDLIQSGYYPRGGGEAFLTIKPSQLHGCLNWNLEDSTHALIRLGKLPLHIAERETKVLKELGVGDDISIIEEFTYSPGNALLLWRGFCGATNLGKLGKPAEQVAVETAEIFEQEQAQIDQHLADQLLLYAALAEGTTHYQTSRITSHLETHLYVLSKFINKKIEINDLKILIS